MHWTWPPSSWPAFLIGLILLTYWLRVMQMVRTARATAGHDANLVPPEPLGRFLRLLWGPVVVLWVLLPTATALFDFQCSILRPLIEIPSVQWAAVPVALAAFAATWICWRNMGKSWRMGINPNEKTELIFDGPFAYVRHPIYGLSSLLMAMTMLAVPSVLMLVVGCLHLLLLQWEVRREDRYLVSIHGAGYRDYQARVGRFLPKSFVAYRSATCSSIVSSLGGA